MLLSEYLKMNNVKGIYENTKDFIGDKTMDAVGDRVKVTKMDSDKRGRTGIVIKYIGDQPLVRFPGGDEIKFDLGDLQIADTKDSVNYLGEKEYSTYEAWRTACKKINPSVQFEGDKDICQAKPNIGEWDGSKGIIYTKDSVPWYADISQDGKTEALIALFSQNKVIEDHKDFHSLADELGIDPSEFEEAAYSLLQSFFSQGRYMKEGQQKDFDPDELAMGDKVELEHTDNPVIARRIALDHLTELPDYYTRLKKMEN
jgi:hypothetical protein